MGVAGEVRPHVKFHAAEREREPINQLGRILSWELIAIRIILVALNLQ
jgi:hypothetical protein